MHFKEIRSGPPHHIVQDRAQDINNNKIVPVPLITITANHNSSRAPRGDAKAQEQDIIMIQTMSDQIRHLITIEKETTENTSTEYGFHVPVHKRDQRDNVNENEIETQIIE